MGGIHRANKVRAEVRAVAIRDARDIVEPLPAPKTRGRDPCIPSPPRSKQRQLRVARGNGRKEIVPCRVGPTPAHGRVSCFVRRRWRDSKHTSATLRDNVWVALDTRDSLRGATSADSVSKDHPQRIFALGSEMKIALNSRNSLVVEIDKALAPREWSPRPVNTGPRVCCNGSREVVKGRSQIAAALPRTRMHIDVRSFVCGCVGLKTTSSGARLDLEPFAIRGPSYSDLSTAAGSVRLACRAGRYAANRAAVTTAMPAATNGPGFRTSTAYS